MSLNTFRLREEQKRVREGERQELEARLAPVKAATVAALKDAEKATRLYWSQPLRVLASFTNRQDFQADLGVTFPSTDEQQSGTRGRAEFSEFVNVTLPKTGFFLSESGSQRLLYFVLAQAFSENCADMSNPATWQIAFDRLYQLGCFDEAHAELGYDETQRVAEPVVEQPEPKLTIDDLEKIDTSTREGAAKARAIVSNAIFLDGEATRVFHEFIRHVAKTFGHDLTPDQQFEAVEWFSKSNKSFLDRRAYDECRRNLVHRGILPHSCLTEDERLCAEIEQDDTRSYEGRRNILQQVAAARRRS